MNETSGLGVMFQDVVRTARSASIYPRAKASVSESGNALRTSPIVDFQVYPHRLIDAMAQMRPMRPVAAHAKNPRIAARPQSKPPMVATIHNTRTVAPSSERETDAVASDSAISLSARCSLSRQ